MLLKYKYINIYLLNLIKYKFKNPFYTKTLSNFDKLLRCVLLLRLFYAHFYPNIISFEYKHV